MGKEYIRVERIAKTFGLADSLTHLWFYGVHIGYGFGLPFGYAHSRPGCPQQIKKFVQEFHLDLQVREILLHGVKNSVASRNLKNWDDLGALQNALTKCGNDLSGVRAEIWLTLHRLGHQQVPYFDRVNSEYIGRYWLLFRQPPLANLIRQTFGMDAFEYMLLVAGVFTVYMQSPSAKLVHALSGLGLPSGAVENRINSVITTPQKLRDELARTQRFDASWAYTFNPLVERPLIRMRVNEPDTFMCPRPPILIRRLLAGAYFDLVKVSGFDKAFGDAVEAVVGHLLANAGRRFKLEKPVPYNTSSGRRLGADWIISDATGDVFIECKSARIPLQAQVALSADDVERGMSRLADAVVQNYGNIFDARSGKTAWVERGKPIFSLVVTLEDWILFSPLAVDALQRTVEARLAEKNLPITLLTDVPYVVAPVRDLPALTHAMAARGCAPLLSKKCDPSYKQYLMSSFLNETEPGLQHEAAAFQQEKDALFREMAARLGPSASASRASP